MIWEVVVKMKINLCRIVHVKSTMAPCFVVPHTVIVDSDQRGVTDLFEHPDLAAIVRVLRPRVY